MIISMWHALHFTLACMRISDNHRIEEEGTLSQHLTEWSNLIQVGIQKNVFTKNLPYLMERARVKPRNFQKKWENCSNKLNLGFSQGIYLNRIHFRKLSCLNKLSFRISKGLLFVFKNEILKWIEPRDKPRYRIYFQMKFEMNWASG